MKITTKLTSNSNFRFDTHEHFAILLRQLTITRVMNSSYFTLVNFFSLPYYCNGSRFFWLRSHESYFKGTGGVVGRNKSLTQLFFFVFALPENLNKNSWVCDYQKEEASLWVCKDNNLYCNEWKLLEPTCILVCPQTCKAPDQLHRLIIIIMMQEIFSLICEQVQ